MIHVKVFEIQGHKKLERVLPETNILKTNHIFVSDHNKIHFTSVSP